MVDSESSVLGGEVVFVVASGVARRMHTRSQGPVHNGFNSLWSSQMGSTHCFAVVR